MQVFLALRYQVLYNSVLIVLLCLIIYRLFYLYKKREFLYSIIDLSLEVNIQLNLEVVEK